jgi:hypothetical protein
VIKGGPVGVGPTDDGKFSDEPPEVNHPSWLPRKQVWPVSFVAVLAAVGLLVVVLQLVADDDQKSRQKTVDQRLQAICERNPAPSEVRSIVGEVAGRFQEDKGCA